MFKSNGDNMQKCILDLFSSNPEGESKRVILGNGPSPTPLAE